MMLHGVYLTKTCFQTYFASDSNKMIFSKVMLVIVVSAALYTFGFGVGTLIGVEIVVGLFETAVVLFLLVVSSVVVVVEFVVAISTIGIVVVVFTVVVGLVVVVVDVVVIHFSSPETSFNVPGSISSVTLLYSGCLQQISDPQKHFASRGPRSILRFFLPPIKPLMFIIVAPFVMISPAKQP